MKFPKAISLKKTCEIIMEQLHLMMHNVESIDESIEPKIIRGENNKIGGVSTLDNPKSNTLIYVSGNTKNVEKAKLIEDVEAIITIPEFEEEFNNKPTIVTSFPKLCLAALTNNYIKRYVPSGNSKNILFASKETTDIASNVVISPNCYIGKNVKIADSSILYPFVFIGDNVQIGENVIIYPNSTVMNDVKIGNNVILHPGSVIGGDGFGYEQVLDNNVMKHVKLPHAGTVRIENNVEVGCNTSIDRGFIDDTIIEEGTKIDNNVQIAHNVHIGRRCILAGQSGIAGSSSIGDEVVLFGQVGIADHISVGKRAVLTAQSGVMNDIPDSDDFIWWAGTPAIQAYKNWKTVVIAQNKLPALITSLQRADDFNQFKDHYSKSTQGRRKVKENEK